MERVLIVEDEPLAAQKLKMLLPQIDARLQVVGMVGSVAEAVQWLATNSPDLLFLDINLSDDLSFKIFERVTVHAPVIFVTAYDQYAIKAFKHNGIDYILKPFDEEELRKSVNRFFDSKTNTTALQRNLEQLLHSFRPPIYKKRLFVTFGDKSKSVSVDEVAFFYAYEKGVFLTTFASQTYLTDETMEELEVGLDGSAFFRLNRKFIINIRAIAEVEKYSNRQLRLQCKPAPKFDVVVPAEKITPFKNWLGR
jgi:two-component system response regulator LytT